MMTTVGKFIDKLVTCPSLEEFHHAMKVFDFKESNKTELLTAMASTDLTVEQLYWAKIYLIEWYSFSVDADDDDGTFVEALESVFDRRKEAKEIQNLEETQGRAP